MRPLETTLASDTAQRATRRARPILSRVPGSQRSWLRFDISASLTVCGLLVPVSMA